MSLRYEGALLRRRQFLKLMAAAVGGIVFGGGISRGVSLLGQSQAKVCAISAASYGDNLTDLLQRALREFADFQERCRGAKVLLKPNLVEYHADRPVNTHPSVVVAAAEVFRSMGAREVVVAEGPGHQRDTELLLEYSGMADALRAVKVPFVDLNLDDIAPVPLGVDYTGLGRLFLPTTLLSADIVVSMPKLKTHKWTGVTLSLKNLFGVVPGAKYGWPKNILHWRGIDQSIWDIYLAVKPAFAIVDGIIGMEGNGPIDGTPVNSGVLVLGEHLPAVDATAARLMGIYPERLSHLTGLIRHGGTIARERISQRGEPIASLMKDFGVAAHNQAVKETPSGLHWFSAT